MRRYKRAVRRMSVTVIALALLLRILMQTGMDVRAGQAMEQAFSSPQVASFLFYLESGQAVTLPDSPADQMQTDRDPPGTQQTVTVVKNPVTPQEAQETDTGVPQEQVDPQVQTPDTAPQEPQETQDSAAAPQEPGAPLVFTPAEAEAITIGGKSTYSVDKVAALLQKSQLNFNQEGPTVLIVHTHTSEAYTQEAGWEYDENETTRTQDPNFSVIRVGTELKETLEGHGISVIHDISFNDYPSYNGAYKSTLQKIESWVSQYPSIQMVIDVHRDAASNEDGTPIHRTATIDGESTAQLMLVMGTDEGGLSHPNWRGNLNWGLKLQAVLNRMYPGLCRNLDLRTERFNQHATPGSVLVEVGASGNTLKQAILAARDLGEGLAALIAGTSAS